MQKHEWMCSICDKILSTKYRLAYHMQHIHNVSVDNIKRYKLYKTDTSLPVPRATQYRQQLKRGNEQRLSHGESSLGSESITCASSSGISSSLCCFEQISLQDSCNVVDVVSNSSEHGDETACSCFEQISLQDSCNVVDVVSNSSENRCGDETTCSDLNICTVNTSSIDLGNKQNFDNISYSNGSESNNLDIECLQDHVDQRMYSSDDLESDMETNSNTSEDFSASTLFSSDQTDSDTTDSEESGNQPIAMSDYDQKCCVLLSVLMKNHVTEQGSRDLLQAYNMLTEKTNTYNDITLDILKQKIGVCDIEIVDFCSDCYTLFPKDDTILECVLPNCHGLRFKGSLDEQSLKRRKCYFACLPLEHQLKDILERDDVWSVLKQYRSNCEMEKNITDILNGEMYQAFRQPGQFLHNDDNISLLFNTDGIPLYKSSCVSIWPVYLVINELPPSMRFSKRHIILWGIWQAQDKPVFRTFFQPFIEQMVKLKQHGVTLNLSDTTVHSKVILLAGTLDLQAKAMMADMTHHNGQFGCLTCVEPGKVVAQGRGHCRVYPFRQEPATPRSTTGFLESAMTATPKHPVQGVKGVSCLFGMEWFDIVLGLVPDYMHSALLGVTKQITTLLFASRYSKEPFFIGRDIKAIDKRLMNMKPTDQVTRLPRKLEKQMSHLKATEHQMWLLFYAIPCLMGIMKPAYLDHLALLIEGIYILVSDNVNLEQLNRAEMVLTTFYQQFKDLYGENHCTLNLHNVCQHLILYVRKLGPLWAWSCFPFEDMNGNLLKYVHGTGDVCRQILWRAQAEKRLALDAEQISNPQFKNFVKQMINVGRQVKGKIITQNCEIAGGMSIITLEQGMEKKLIDCLKLNADEDIGNVFKFSRMILNESVYYSESYKRMSKRVGHVVLASGDVNMAVVKYYLYHETSKKCAAVVNMLVINTGQPLVHPLVKHLLNVKLTSTGDLVIPVDVIREKLLWLDGNRNVCCVARLPNLNNSCR